MTTTPSSKPSRAPWIVAGVLGCLVVCLLLVVVGTVGYVILGPTKGPVANVPVTAVTRAPFGLNPTSAPPTVAFPTSPAQPTIVIALPTSVPAATAVVTPTLPSAPTATAKVAATATAVPKGKIAFSRDEGERPEDKSIWIMNVDGTGAKKVIDRASSPSISPDGTKIAYFHYEDGIFVANIDGSDAKKVVGDTYTRYLEWSHDGRLIAFTSRPGGSGNASVDVAPPDGTALKDSANRRSISVGFGPSWSPDDTQVVFNTCQGNTCGIYKSSSAPGSEAVPVIGDGGGLPSWSPDGKKILYQTEIDGQKQLFLINPDGSGKKQLTSGAVMHVSAAWSLDGNYIYYRSPEAGSWGIWRINSDGSNPVKLIDNMPPVDWPYERLAVGK